MKIDNIKKYTAYILFITGFLTVTFGNALLGYSIIVIGIILIVSLLRSVKEKEKSIFLNKLSQNESIIKYGIVSIRTSNTKAENGILFLTNERLYYSGIGKQSEGFVTIEKVIENNFEILLSNVLSVEAKFPNYLVVTSKNGDLFKLIPFGKRNWRDKIQMELEKIDS